MKLIIAGKEYGPLRYTLTARHELEQRSERGVLQTMTSGLLNDQALLLWVGLKDAHPKLSVPGIIRLFEQHNDSAPEADYFKDIVQPAQREALRCKLAGYIDEKDIERFFGVEPGKE